MIFSKSAVFYSPTRVSWYINGALYRIINKNNVGWKASLQWWWHFCVIVLSQAKSDFLVKFWNKILEVLFWFCFEIGKYTPFKKCFFKNIRNNSSDEKTHEIRREKIASNGDEMYTFSLHQIQIFKAKLASGMRPLRNDTEAGASK